MRKLDLTGQRFGRLLVLSSESKKGVVYSKCKCDCGKETETVSSNLIKKNRPVKSCGCLRSENLSKIRKKEFGISTLNSLYLTYKNMAKVRGLLFLLTREEFRTLVDGICTYCGREPFRTITRKGHYGSYTCNGIDRVDNNVGYLLENCVSCCRDCNFMKKNKTVHEFIEQITRIYLRYGK